MRGKKELLILITGFSLFIFDLGSDIFVAVKYWKNGNVAWFAATVSIICASLFVVTIVARDKTIEAKKISRLETCVRLFSSIFLCYIHQFRQWKRRYWDTAGPCEDKCGRESCVLCESYRNEDNNWVKSVYIFSKMHYTEAMVESAPQWCLQIYIMLRQWQFPWYTVLSAVFSLLSLAWNVTTLERGRTERDTKYKRGQKWSIVFSLWQLSCFVSRFAAKMIFAHVFHQHIFTLLCIHLVIVNVGLTIDKTCRKKENFRDCLVFLLKKPLFIFPLVFHPSEATLYWCGYRKQTGMYYRLCVIYVVLSLENIAMVTLSLVISRPDVPHVNNLRTLTIMFLVMGLIIGTISLVVQRNLKLARVWPLSVVINTMAGKKFKGTIEFHVGGRDCNSLEEPESLHETQSSAYQCIETKIDNFLE
ncbi:XK-related protein 6-like [Dendronephthya gigantea]|uniref:XK-related protein 6-like n=1 Tax=Dendronephthya gigantea TaxID=151771 RepID=UPI00106BBE98|nr:XK-related protein 6-like [Dendronephthya gigantea]